MDNQVQVYELQYKYIPEKDIVCLLCEGSHGRNALCQMSTEDDRHEIC